MAEQPERVYQDTTEDATRQKDTCCILWRKLGLPRFGLKVLELVLSLIAFLCEEFVEHCQQCSGLYFFEFVSCTALLLCVVVLVVYCTKLGDRFTLKLVQCMDVWYTAVVGIAFFLASIIFAATSYGSTVESCSFVFGFLASVLFLADFVYLWRKEGVRPCKSHQREGTVQNPGRPGENVALNEGAEP